MMNVIICCGRKFGLQVLQLCEAKDLNIIAVVTPKDDILIRPYCDLMEYLVISPDNLTSATLPINIDLGINAYSFEKISCDVLSVPKYGWLGYHPSLLPRHRGRSAIEWALRKKDVITGGTLYWLDDGMDKGDIAYQEWIFLDPEKTAKQVWNEQLMPMGLELFGNAIDDLKLGLVFRKPQAPLLKFATSEPGL